MYSQGTTQILLIVSITIFLGSVCVSVSKSEIGENEYAFVPPVFSSEFAPKNVVFGNQGSESVIVQRRNEHLDQKSEFGKPSYDKAIDWDSSAKIIYFPNYADGLKAKSSFWKVDDEKVQKRFITRYRTSFLRAIYEVGSVNSSKVLGTTTTDPTNPLPQVVAGEATQLISESYEYADNSTFWKKWLTFNDGRSTITTEEARTGKNSLRIDYGVNKNVVVHRDFTSTTSEIYMKFYIKLAPTFGAKGFKFARWRSTRPFNAQVEMWLSSSNLSVGGNIYGECKGKTHPFYTRSFPDWKGGWHKIEVHTVYKEGTTKIWSDGVLVANVSGIDFGSCVFSNVVVPGNMGASETGTPNDVLYIDDLEVWDGKPSS